MTGSRRMPTDVIRRRSKTDNPYEVQGKRASALGVRLASLAKTGPMALIQCLDFATDILVIAELYADGDSVWPIVASGFVGASVLGSLNQVLVVIRGALHAQRAIALKNKTKPDRVLDYVSDRDFMMTCALTPFNLHLFYWASLIGKAEQVLWTPRAQQL